MFAEKIYKTNEYDYKLYDRNRSEFNPSEVESEIKNYKYLIDLSKVFVEFT